VQNSVDAPIHVLLDAQGYRKRRAKQLEKDADRAVAEVARTGRRVELEPMTSSERKVIHQYLKDVPDVQTVSAGREPNRRLAVEPRQD
jgi:spoIIIJ-associated protein